MYCRKKPTFLDFLKSSLIFLAIPDKVSVSSGKPPASDMVLSASSELAILVESSIELAAAGAVVGALAPGVCISVVSDLANDSIVSWSSILDTSQLDAVAGLLVGAGWVSGVVVDAEPTPPAPGGVDVVDDVDVKRSADLDAAVGVDVVC